MVRELCLGIGPEALIRPTKKVLPFEGKIDYSHIMWIDSDVIFKPEDVVKLLSHDLDIVSGLCKISPNTYSLTVEGARGFVKEKDIVSENLIEAKSVGAAFLLVKRGVFERIERPWFQTTIIEENGEIGFVGEDMYFCWKARKAGFKIFVDPTVKVNHLKLGYL
jgi:hypothetical protein